MTAATKQQALEKLDAIANKIGYPDKWRDYSTRDDRRATTCSATSTRADAFEVDARAATRSASRSTAPSGA